MKLDMFKAPILKLNLFLTLGISIFLAFCSNPVEYSVSDASEQVIIDGEKISDTVDVSEFVEEINIIPLKEVEGDFLGGVEEVFYNKGRYIIFDRYYSKKILIFDNNGNFLKSLNPLGGGPEEIMQMNDCWLNEEGELEVYDFSLGKILVYNENYEINKVIHAKDILVFKSIMKIPKTLDYVGYNGYNPNNGKPFKIAFLDSLLGLKKMAFQYDGELRYASIKTPLDPFFKFGDSIRFAQNYDPNIYNINPDGHIIKRYELVYTYNPLPHDYEDQLIKRNLNIFKAQEHDFSAMANVYKGYTGFRSPWWETDNYLIIYSFDTEQNPFGSVYHKGEKRIIAQGRLFSETSKFKMALPSHFYTTKKGGNHFITVMEGYSLISHISRDSPFFEVVNKELESFFIVDIDLK